ncbi:MAG: 50S ribosomal protein L21 [Coriobacteriales bacterium]|nr:50S ribosomal protein L21 [Coriobacteriales bacterium]
MYAIVKTGGKQYTVKPGDVLDVEKIEGEAGDRVDLQVLLLNDGNKVVADAAEAAKVKVTAEIIDQHKGKKQLVFKFKKRKGYKRTKGHRQQLTKIAIVDVNGVTAKAPKPQAPKVEQAPKAEPKAAEPKAEEPAAQAEAPAKDLSKMTVAQLKDLAAEKGIKVPSGARKAEIVELIQNA